MKTLQSHLLKKVALLNIISGDENEKLYCAVVKQMIKVSLLVSWW